MLEYNVSASLAAAKPNRTRRKDVDDRHATDELTRLEEQAANSGMEIAVDRINGHWRAGFLTTDELGEAVFVLHANRT